MSNMQIYIVDESEDYRLSVSSMLSCLGYDVVGFSKGSSFVTFLNGTKCELQGCLLMDAFMPDMSGLELHDLINNSNHKIPVIYMTSQPSVYTAVEAMKKGAITYLEKPLVDTALEKALVIAEKLNQMNFNGIVGKEVKSDIQCNLNNIAYKRRLATLTPREREVLYGVVEGKMNKVLAIDMGISIKTIELHRASVRKKLNAKNFADLIKMVITQRIIA